MIITLLRVYSVVLGLVTLTLFHGNRFVRNINCKLHVLDSSPLQFKHCIVVTLVHTSKVSWYFEPSQSQRIISGLKTNFSLSPNHSVHKSSKHKFSEIFKICSDTNSHKTKHPHTNTKQKVLKELVFPLLPLKKKAHKARTCWYRGPFHRFITTRFWKSI